jgi:hypothetical protein
MLRTPEEGKRRSEPGAGGHALTTGVAFPLRFCFFAKSGPLLFSAATILPKAPKNIRPSHRLAVQPQKIAIQPPISTIHCKCLYSLANFVVHSFMLSSPNPQISSSQRPTPALSRTSSISFTCITSFTSSSVAQSLPTFSTPSKHRPHSNARNSIPFMRLLHTSRHHGGGGYLLALKALIQPTSSFRSKSRPATRLTPFLATLTDSPQLAENSPTLSPFPATLTQHVNHNPFVCHSYRKHPGVGGYPLSAKFLPHFSPARNSIKISTYKTDTKQTTLSSLESMLTKNREGGPDEIATCPRGRRGSEPGVRRSPW